MKIRRMIYYVLSAIVGFTVSSAVVHVWIHNTMKWPITYLAIAALCLHVRQIVYHDLMRRALLETFGSQSRERGSIDG